MKAKICRVCGNAFEAKTPNEKYCCIACREAGRKQRRAIWKAEHPRYYLHYMRSYRAQNAPERPKTNEAI